MTSPLFLIRNIWISTVFSGFAGTKVVFFHVTYSFLHWEKYIPSHMNREQPDIFNVRNDAIRTPLRSALNGKDRGHGQQENIEVLSYNYSGAAITVFQSSKVHPLEIVPGGWRMVFVDVLESVQRTGINGLSYRVLRWGCRARMMNMDKLWPIAYLQALQQWQTTIAFDYQVSSQVLSMTIAN